MDNKLAKEFLFDVADIMEAHDVDVFISDGTCLGAYRDGDFIDWDHDIDIKARAEELIPKLKVLSNEFRRKGYDVRPLRFGFVMHGVVLRHNGLIMDLHGMYLIDGKRWRFGNRYTHAYPAEFFNDVVERINFLNRIFFMPTPVEEYFECLYGEDYMIPKKVKPGPELESLRDKSIYGRIEPEDVPRFEAELT